MADGKGYDHVSVSQGWPIGDGLGPGRPVKGYDKTSLQTVHCPIVQVIYWHYLDRRENCFQQSDKCAGHVNEGLHLYSVGL